jgi:hypothetical protein
MMVCNMEASLYEPINTYKAVGPNIGIVDGPFEYLTLGGVKLPLPFTTRMTVVRLSNGDLFLHSPIKFDGRLANELLGLGGGFGELDGCLNARRFLLATGGGRGCAIAAIDCGSDQQLR